MFGRDTELDYLNEPRPAPSQDATAPMPVEYDSERDWFVLGISMQPDAHEVISGLSEMIDHPSWEDGKRRLVRMPRGADLSLVTLEHLLEVLKPWLAAHASKFAANRPAAIIVNDDIQKVWFDFYKVTPGARELLNIHPFSSEKAAVDFLEAEGR